MRIAVFRTSNKENEKRLPLYPEHLSYLSEKVRSCLCFEEGYGEDYGFSDDDLRNQCNVFMDRDSLFDECDILILPKATVIDLEKMHEGQILWGWAHCVQQSEITQAAIDNNITIVAWENMHHWGSRDEKLLHVFYKNNELAGYSAVIHVLELLGMDGHYGPRKRVSIIGYGSVSRGAIYALQGRGFNNLHVFSRRPSHLVADQNPDAYYYHLFLRDGEYYCAPSIGDSRPFADELFDSDVIVNGILQDPMKPAVFVKDSEIHSLRRNAVIIDISCDKGMCFEFAVPTSFDHPIIHHPNNVAYYSVDHAPTYLWNAASREISKALIPFLTELIGNECDFHKELTLSRAIEIEEGTIRNSEIISFQKRDKAYPHSYL